jgi:beta-glucosidase
MSSNSSTIAKRRSSNSTSDNSTSTLTTSSDFGSYNVVIGKKAFPETYLAPFYDDVKNVIAGSMRTKNKVNGTYSCENQGLFADYLKFD